MSDTRLFLTDLELRDLTGKQVPSAQAKVLRRNGLRFFIRADGHLRVPRQEINRSDSNAPTRRWAPDFSQFRKSS